MITVLTRLLLNAGLLWFHTLAFSGFRPKEKMITEIANKLAELNLNKDDTVVLDLLSNSVFMGTDPSGLPTEALRAEDGSYHIVASLAIAPASVTKKFWRGALLWQKFLKVPALSSSRRSLVMSTASAAKTLITLTTSRTRNGMRKLCLVWRE